MDLIDMKKASVDSTDVTAKKGAARLVMTETRRRKLARGIQKLDPR
jgi:hypothetical protein